jgi:hypothetical protein
MHVYHCWAGHLLVCHNDVTTDKAGDRPAKQGEYDAPTDKSYYNNESLFLDYLRGA